MGRDGRVGLDVLDAGERVEGRDVVGRELKRKAAHEGVFVDNLAALVGDALLDPVEKVVSICACSL